MSIRRIVPDFKVADPSEAASFYGDVLGLTKMMDQGFITTWGDPENPGTQVSFGTEGGSGTPMPDLSIEVSDLDGVLETARAQGFEIVYGPVVEPWGVRRFYVKDPFGKVINILSHETS